MTKKRQLIIASSVIGIAVVAYFALPRVFFGYAIARSFHEQGVQNEAARPLFDAVVARKLKIGDSLEHAEEVLSYAGLSFNVVQDPFSRRMLQSFYRAGPSSGFSIQIELDSADRITKIDIHEVFTGP